MHKGVDCDAASAHQSARARILWIDAWITVLGSGLALRLIAINSRGLWSDEAWRVWAARLPSAVDVLRVAWAQPPSAPLYWIGLHAWISLFGHGDVAVRIFSLIPSVLNIVALYWLGKLMGGPRVGMLAAALLTCAPMAVEVGQEATMYAWTMLIATLALASGLNWLQTGRGAKRYIAACVLLIYIHYLGPLLLAWFFVAILLSCRAPGRFGIAPVLPPRTWFRAHILIFVFWLPWGIAMVVRIVARWTELRQLQHSPRWSDLYHTAAHLLFSASPQTFWHPVFVMGAVASGGLVLAWALWRSQSHSPAWLCMVIMIGMPGTLLAGAAVTGAWLFQPRFLTLILPLLLSVLALGAAVPMAGWRQSAAAALVTVVWLGLQIGGLVSFYTQPVHGRDGMREIGALLTKVVVSGDVVVGNHPLLLWTVSQYYAGPLHGLPADWDVRKGYPLTPPPQPAWVETQLAALPGIIGAAPRLWLLYLPVVDPDGTLLGSIRMRYHLSETHAYPLLTVYLFTRNAP